MQSPHKSERYILVSKSIYYKDLLGYLAEALHKKPPKKRMKKRALVIIGNLDYIANKVFRTKRRLFPATMRSLYTISFYDSSKIEKELNFTFTPYKETLAQVAKNYLKDH